MAMNSNIKQLPHQPIPPLSIERDWSRGYEVIIIEGVRYSSDFFRMNSMPRDDALYAVRKMDDGDVHVTTIIDVESAKKFFDEIGQGDPAPTEEENVL